MVSASDAAGDPVVVLVDPASDGVTRTTTPSSRGETEATYEFDGAPILGVLAEGAADVLRQHVVAGALLQGDGLVSGARDLTAGYVKERTQFGRQLAEFQGVAMQVADVYVTSRMLSLAAEEASRRVAAGEPSGADLAVGAFWFCDRAPAALQTCHHLHGGVGVDETYPLHRYFARVKDLARLLGGAEATLEAVPADRTDDANSELTAEQRSFKDEVRAYFSGLVSPEDRLEMMTDRHGEAYHRTIRQMGEDGWMGVGWPVEYGGKGLGGIEQQIFANEAARADVHLPAVTLQTVGPTLQAYGTELQKDMFLKAILAGEVHFAIGYSEADAGTDLASLRTHGEEGRRPLRRQRPEDVDHRWPRRRLHLAGRAHGHRGPQAQGHLGADRRHEGPGLLLDADHHLGRLAPRQRDLLQRRPGARRDAGRRGERGLAADHYPAQPRARDARSGRSHRGTAGHGRRLGSGTHGCLRHSAARPCPTYGEHSRGPPPRSGSTSC